MQSRLNVHIEKEPKGFIPKYDKLYIYYGNVSTQKKKKKNTDDCQTPLYI